jgi:hypothetical protein
VLRFLRIGIGIGSFGLVVCGLLAIAMAASRLWRILFPKE